jgi:hypothetical protein
MLELHPSQAGSCSCSPQVILEAYGKLCIIHSQFQHGLKDDPKDQELVREALGFLIRKGNSKVQQGSIDCTKYLVNAANVFMHAPPEFTKRYSDFWSAYGVLSGELLSHNGRTHADIGRSEIIGSFSDKFEQVEWSQRAGVIAGFSELAMKYTERDNGFWQCVKHLEELCYYGLQYEAEELQYIGAAVRDLLDLWWRLADEFGDQEDVRWWLADRAESLLTLLIQSDPFHTTDRWSSWVQALRQLHLPVADALQEQVPPLARSEFQGRLNKLAEAIFNYSRSQNAALRRWILDIRPNLIPYLHGREPRFERVAPFSQSLRTCKVWMRFAGANLVENRSYEATIQDICPRTRRGFRIEVEGLVPDKTYDVQEGLNGMHVEGRPCRTIVAKNAGGTLEIDELLLDLSCSSDGRVSSFQLSCRVLRAWPEEPKEKKSGGFALLAEPPPEADHGWQLWQDFVKRLPKHA